MRPSHVGRPTLIIGGAVATASSVSDQVMPDRCEITRRAETGSLTGTTYTTDAAVVVYRGPCRVQTAQPHPLRATEVVFGETPMAQRMYLVAVPKTVSDVRVGDAITFLGSTDPTLVQRPLRVTNIGRGSFADGRYLLCNDPQEAV